MKYDICWIVMVMSLKFSFTQLTDTSETQNFTKMMRTMCFAGLALLVGVTHMKHFIVKTKEGKIFIVFT